MQISFAFCPSCGESLRNDRQASTDRGDSTCTENVTMETLRNSPRKRASSSGVDQSRPEVLPKTKRAELPTYAQFAAKKSEERRGHFKPKMSKHGKHALPTEATINIGLMEYEEGSNVLKHVRGSSLPLKIKTSASYEEVLDAALKKREAFDHKFSISMQRGYVLAYPDSRICKKIPGTREDFVLRGYKDWLGKPYSRLTLYLSPIEKKETGETGETGESTEIVDWSEFDFDIDILPEIDDLASSAGEVSSISTPNGHTPNSDFVGDITSIPDEVVDHSFLTTDFL